VIVDGVGYPSVGSICDLSNAHLAQALGAPVLLVGKSGVGDAVDSFNINTRFFESYGSFLSYPISTYNQWNQLY
jgi:AAA domain